jgi:hypothetical protein
VGAAQRLLSAAEEKIRIVLDGLRDEHSIAELGRREGIAEGLYHSWSKSSWRPASGGSPVTRPALRPATRTPTSAGSRASGIDVSKQGNGSSRGLCHYVTSASELGDVGHASIGQSFCAGCSEIGALSGTTQQSWEQEFERAPRRGAAV